MQIARYIRESPVCTLERVHRHVLAEVNHALEPFGVNFVQGLVLIAIYSEKRPVNPSELSEAFGLSRVVVSQCLARLDELGFIARNLDNRDARRTNVTIQAKERLQIQRMMNVFHRIQDRFERLLGVGTLKSIQEGLEKLPDSRLFSLSDSKAK